MHLIDREEMLKALVSLLPKPCIKLYVLYTAFIFNAITLE